MSEPQPNAVLPPTSAQAALDQYQEPRHRPDPMRWIHANLEALRRDYPGEWVVVHNERVIAHDQTLSLACHTARHEHGVTTPFVYHVDGKGNGPRHDLIVRPPFPNACNATLTLDFKPALGPMLNVALCNLLDLSPSEGLLPREDKRILGLLRDTLSSALLSGKIQKGDLVP